MSVRRLRALLVGVEDATRTALSRVVTEPSLEAVTDTASWDQVTGDDNLPEKFDLILCGPAPIGVGVMEMAQLFSTLCPSTPLFFASFKTDDLQVRNLTKNGFQDVFVLPPDFDTFREKMAAVEKEKTGEGKKIYKGVSLIDFQPDDRLQFEVSVYLPMNKKYVRIVKPGTSLDAGKLTKFKERQVSKVYVDSTEMTQFYKYSAEKLKALNTASGTMSETERQERLRSSVRRIVLDVFDRSSEATFDSGRELLADTQKIVAEMTGISQTVNVQSELGRLLKQPAETMNKAGRVSTLAALFEMALGLKLTQQAAIAGLFLDIGLAQLPIEIQTTPVEKMTPEQLEQYKSHPEISLRLLQSKRMVITPEIQNALLQHHERVDGSGFPNGLPAHKISPLAQVVAIACRFEELAFGEPDGPTRDPEEIFRQILDEKISTAQFVEPLIRTCKPAGSGAA